MSSSQVAKTEICNNILAYYAHLDPGPLMMVLPTLEMGETWSKNRLAPMIRDSPALASRFATNKARTANNTIREKSFPGGYITIAGANSAASLSSRPIRILVCDEIDRFPLSVGEEGDAIALAAKRQTAFWNRTRLLTSTPTDQYSRVALAYERTSKDQYWVPCPDCAEYQTLTWEQVTWTHDDASTALYGCLHCGSTWNDGQRYAAVRRGEWRSREPTRTRRRGFHLNELYSPFVRLSETVQNWLDAQGKPELLQVFYNTALGLTYEDKSAQDVDADALLNRVENWNGLIPQRAVYLTLGADVQNDRIEYEIVAWAPDLENWSIEYETILGDPRIAPGKPGSPWDELEDALMHMRLHESGHEMRVGAAAIDANYLTDEVLEFTRKRWRRRVFAVRGMGGQGKDTVVSRSKRKGGGFIYTLGVDGIKGRMYQSLAIQDPDVGGYCHFFDDRSNAYFDGLTCEKPKRRYKKGYEVIVWEKPRDARNEPTDCRVYNMATLKIAPPRWRMLERRLTRKLEKTPEQPEASSESTDASQTTSPVKRNRRVAMSGRRRRGYDPRSF